MVVEINNNEYKIKVKNYKRMVFHPFKDLMCNNNPAF